MPSPNPATAPRRTSAELRERRLEKQESPVMAELRRRAEKQMRAQKLNPAEVPGPSPSTADPSRLLHELQVHRIELEMQNAELAETRDRLEGALEKYTDLYDFAPTGYFSLTEQGLILDVNLTGALMLGVERSRLIRRKLQDFVARPERPDFTTFLEKTFAQGEKQSCAMSLLKKDVVFKAEMRAVPAVTLNPEKWCRVAISDVSPLR